MSALLQIAGQDAPPTGGIENSGTSPRGSRDRGMPRLPGGDRTRYHEQQDMSQNRKLNDPRLIHKYLDRFTDMC